MTDKTPLENPTGKEWFAPDYVARPQNKSLNIRFIGPGRVLPPRKEGDVCSGFAAAVVETESVNIELLYLADQWPDEEDDED